jgi:hypothetical protein
MMKILRGKNREALEFTPRALKMQALFGGEVVLTHHTHRFFLTGA